MNNVTVGSAIGTSGLAAAIVTLAAPMLAAHGYQMGETQAAAAVTILSALGHGPVAFLTQWLQSKLSAPATPPTP